MVKYTDAIAELQFRVMQNKKRLDSECYVDLNPRTNNARLSYQHDWLPEDIRKRGAILIGTRAMLESSEKHILSGKVSDKVFVYTMWDEEHEFYHLEDHLYNFADPQADELKKASARSMILASADPIYNQREYLHMISEYEANLFSAITTNEYFKQVHPEVPAEKIIAMKLSSIPEYFPYGKTDDFDDVITYMVEHETEFAKQTRLIDLKHGSGVTQDFIYDSEFRKQYTVCSGNGILSDKIAVDTLLKYHPEYANPYPCIQNEIPEPEKEKSIKKHRDVPESFEDLYQKDQQHADSEKGFGE